MRSVFLACLLSIASLCGQSIPDSLKAKGLSFYIERLDMDIRDSLQARDYAHFYLIKAKEEKNFEEMMYAYKNLYHFEASSIRLMYTDSMIYAAGRTGRHDLLGSAYLTKGIAYYNQKNYPVALDNYLTANGFISKADDPYLLHKLKFHMAQMKSYLGYYNEAIALLRDCIRFYGDDGGQPYLTCLHSLGQCYTRIGKYNLCSEVNALGIRKAIETGDEAMLPYFRLSQGVNLFFLKRFDKAIAALTDIIPSFYSEADCPMKTVALFYIGRSNWEKGNFRIAEGFYRQVVSIFREKGYVRHDFLEALKLAADHFGRTGNKELQLFYLNAAVDAGHVLDQNFRNMVHKVRIGFDLEQAMAQLQNLKGEVSSRKQKDDYLIQSALAVLAVVTILGYVYWRKRKNRRLKRKEIPKRKRKMPEDPEDLGMQSDVIQSILAHLIKFENNRKFLIKGMGLKAMSHMFGHNETYISKVIGYYKGKSALDYINDLRIDYIVEKLENDTNYRKFSQNALSTEAGFGNVNSFRKAFHQKKGVMPLDFVEKLKKA